MDENTPAPPTPAELEPLSVDELEARIVHLQEAIRATEAELKKKRAHLSAADALFGKD